MKKKDLTDLKGKTVVQLKDKASKNKLKLREEMAEFYSKGDNNPKKIRQLKKDIAQLMTIIRQKEIENKLSEDGKVVKEGKK